MGCRPSANSEELERVRIELNRVRVEKERRERELEEAKGEIARLQEGQVKGFDRLEVLQRKMNEFKELLAEKDGMIRSMKKSGENNSSSSSEAERLDW